MRKDGFPALRISTIAAEWVMPEQPRVSTSASSIEDIRHGKDPKEAFESNIGTYGRYENAPKYIDPREE